MMLRRAWNSRVVLQLGHVSASGWPGGRGGEAGVVVGDDDVVLVVGLSGSGIWTLKGKGKKWEIARYV